MCICRKPGMARKTTVAYPELRFIDRGGINDKLIGNLSKAVKGFFPYTLKDNVKK